MHNISYFFLPKECPDISFLPHRAWESHALLPVGTAHPSSDFIHCNEVSGAEGQRTRKATSDPQLVLLAITGVPVAVETAQQGAPHGHIYLARK